jgi:hypothetical protein
MSDGRSSSPSEAFKKTLLNIALKTLDFVRQFLSAGAVKRTVVCWRPITYPKLRPAVYTRVSTLDQDPAMQLRELHAYAINRRLL